MGHADPKVRTSAPRVSERVRVLDTGETIVARRVVNASAARRAMRAILRDMPKNAHARESIRAKLQAARQRG
jgi:hypothetical protein